MAALGQIMIKKVILFASVFIIVLVLAIFFIIRVKSLLFHDMSLVMEGAAGLGILTGIWRGITANGRLVGTGTQPDRHNIDSFLEHWGTATGILLLALSGLFIQLHYQRIFSNNLHFLGLVIMLFFGTYFLAHFLVSKKYRDLVPNIKDITEGTIKKYLVQKPWKDTRKYLASQRTSFLVFAILGLIILASGIIKVLAYYYGIPMQLLLFATSVHDVTAILFGVMVLIHVLIVTLGRTYRRFLPSFFTGKIKEP